MTHIYISTPCYNAQMLCYYTISLLNTISVFHRNNINYTIDFLGNESLISRARNRALEKFLASSCTHLLFIDSDISFEPEAILDLLAFDKDVVGCAYPKKEINTNRFLTSLKLEPNSKEKLESRFLDFVFNMYYDSSQNALVDGNFVQTRHVGTGFMLIKRDIIERLCPHHPELTVSNGETPGEHCYLFNCMIKNKEHLSEDYSFCERVRDIGGEVWLSRHHNLQHVGLYAFSSDIKNRVNVY